MQIITKADQLFNQGNLHMKNKLKHFGSQGANCIKYIISKMRLYRQKGFFESNATIAQNVGCCVKTVQNAIKRAEQLQIFLVSERHETTLNNCKRQTTNLIQMLKYSAIEVVKNVVTKVRTITSNLVQIITQPTTPRPSNNAPRQRYTRIEVVPEWLHQEQPIQETTLEQQLAIDSLQQRLREKYGKGKT